jgi:mono/diheme cytochrome c family protein
MARLCSIACLLLVAIEFCAAGEVPVTREVTVQEKDTAQQELQSLEQDFEARIVPLIRSHCLACHGTETQEAQLDLTTFQKMGDVAKSHRVWATVLERVEAGEMPPDEAEENLSPAERESIVNWSQTMLQVEANRNAGDPGPVIARRLSNAEYDYSIRDLTGVDIRPTQTFPVDPANEAGFDNSGESLSMSPALMTKYLEAARAVVDHLVFTPEGFRFAPHPVVTDTDRDKYCVKRIVEFYQRQPTDYADYFFAAWKYKHRKSFGAEAMTLADIAGERGLSAKYLSLIWETLSEESVSIGPLAKLQQMWSALPQDAESDQVRVACEGMRDFVVQTRRPFEPRIDNLHTKGVHDGSQPFVLWKNDQYAKHRRSASFAFLHEEPKKVKPADAAIAMQLARELLDEPDREQVIAAYAKFCSVFPDAFYVSERGRDYLGIPRDEQEKGRLLSAGFHSMMGYYRDDRSLYDLVLDDREQQELDALWQELDFFAGAPQRQYQGFLWFDRTDSQFMRDAEFDFARPEDKSSLSQEKIEKLSEVFTAKAARNGGGEVPLQAIRDFFTTINRQIRWVEQARVAAEPKQLDAVLALASRAYRRPLSATEDDELRDYYQRLRGVDALPHDEALQDTIVSVLMSPHFCYRVDVLADSDATRPLNDIELASRLSYFLWSSLPDAELLQLAIAGDLHEPETLLKQTRRMLQDDRIRGMATEFAGNWLDFRRFEEHNSVDRERFPSFNDELRSAMFEEPIRFFVDVVQQDRSTLDFLFADWTFVNASLAKHYGINDLKFDGQEWQMVSNAREHARGGLLPMSVFLTKNAPGLRTSPVKRGYWVVRNLLGEHIPPPPPDVPDLPNDESKLGELTLSETLAKHREHESCSGCHDRIDPLGLVFEGFGPIGERREVDLGGRPVQTQAIFPDGNERKGVEELREYLLNARAGDFVDNLHRKLLSYALGRTLLLSDEILLQKLREDAQINDHRFGALIETIVTSPQFLNKRGRHSTNLADAGESQ